MPRILYRLFVYYFLQTLFEPSVAFDKCHYLFVGWHKIGAAMFGDNNRPTGITHSSGFEPPPIFDLARKKSGGKGISSP